MCSRRCVYVTVTLSSARAKKQLVLNGKQFSITCSLFLFTHTHAHAHAHTTQHKQHKPRKNLFEWLPITTSSVSTCPIGTTPSLLHSSCARQSRDSKLHIRTRETSATSCRSTFYLQPTSIKTSSLHLSVLTGQTSTRRAASGCTVKSSSKV